MTDNQAKTIIEKLTAELNPELESGDWDLDFAFECGIEKAINIVKEVMGYDVGESSGDS